MSFKSASKLFSSDVNKELWLSKEEFFEKSAVKINERTYDRINIKI